MLGEYFEPCQTSVMVLFEINGENTKACILILTFVGSGRQLCNFLNIFVLNMLIHQSK